jgi:hypothetical protein
MERKSETMQNDRKFLGLGSGLLLLLIVLVPVAGAQETPNVIEVGLTEYQINMPTSIPAGPTTFRVTNNGTAGHNFEIEGQGIDQALEADLQPGETAEMQVDLVAGTYDVYCPVGDHRGMGMQLELTVTEAQQTPAATPAATEAPAGGAMAETPAATATVTATVQATGTPPQVLPQTGGVSTPWVGIALLVIGGLVLVLGTGLAFARR